MSRIPAFRLMVMAAVAPLAAACGRTDSPETRSTSSGASQPVVSGASVESVDSSSESRTEVKTPTYEQAESAYVSGSYPEAAQHFAAYTERNPENPWGHYMLGLSAWKSGDRDRALSAFERSLQIDPTHRKSMFNMSRVLLETGRSEEALGKIEQALSQEPTSNEGLRLLGRARHQLGKVDEAIEAYRLALAADDRDVWSMNNLGLIYIEQDRSTEALPPLARAVRLKGNAPVFQNNLGMALERSGYPAAAAKAYEAALAVDSTYKKAAVALARVTEGGQPAESQPVDLSMLAQEFLDQIEDWRESLSAQDSVVSVSDSTAPVNDSTVQVSDSITAGQVQPE
jgi:tetratricopeptide (TPR) repeat protein